jgi:hypothetical protein
MNPSKWKTSHETAMHATHAATSEITTTRERDTFATFVALQS